MRNIIVANANIENAKKIGSVLKSAGILVSAVCSTGAQVIHLTSRGYRGGVVICSVKLQDMSAVSLPKMAGEGYEFLYVARGQTAIELEYPCLFQPLSRVCLIASVTMLQRMHEGSSLNLSNRIQSCGMDEKQIVERAKQVLMHRCNMSEPAAHRFLQKRSMNSGKKLCETAMLVLETLGSV